MFPEKMVRREKSILKNKIQSIVDNKITYANMRLIDEMCENEQFSVHTYGYVEDLDKIDAASIYRSYQEMVSNDQFDLYVVGDFQKEEMENKITSAFQKVNLQGKNSTKENEVKTIEKVNEIGRAHV